MERFLRCNLGLFALVHYWNKNYVSRTFDIKKPLKQLILTEKKTLVTLCSFCCHRSPKLRICQKIMNYYYNHFGAEEKLLKKKLHTNVALTSLVSLYVFSLRTGPSYLHINQ